MRKPWEAASVFYHATRREAVAQVYSGDGKPLRHYTEALAKRCSERNGIEVARVLAERVAEKELLKPHNCFFDEDAHEFARIGELI
jgi:hypothetical protein